MVYHGICKWGLNSVSTCCRCHSIFCRQDDKAYPYCPLILTLGKAFHPQSLPLPSCTWFLDFLFFFFFRILPSLISTIISLCLSAWLFLNITFYQPGYRENMTAPVCYYCLLLLTIDVAFYQQTFFSIPRYIAEAELW